MNLYEIITEGKTFYLDRYRTLKNKMDLMKMNGKDKTEDYLVSHGQLCEIEILYLKFFGTQEELNEVSRYGLNAMVKALGYGGLICTSFDEAKENTRVNNIVIIDDADIYITYKDKEKGFGEYVSWVSDEFEEDPELMLVVAEYIKGIYENVVGNYPTTYERVKFTPYDDLDNAENENYDMTEDDLCGFTKPILVPYGREEHGEILEVSVSLEESPNLYSVYDRQRDFSVAGTIEDVINEIQSAYPSDVIDKVRQVCIELLIKEAKWERLPITYEMVRKGYNKGIIYLDESTNADRLVCQIGKYNFTLEETMTETKVSVEAWKRCFTDDEIIKMIYNQLAEVMSESRAEYFYYTMYLIEKGIS